MAIWDSLLPDVQGFLRIHRPGYSKFLEELKAAVNRVRHRPECSHLIYATYSREDKQRGEAFKEDWKIAKKLYEWRQSRPDARIQEIHDIIGMTIVVNFPSDRDALAAFLIKPDALPGFVVSGKEDKRDRGYHAVHLRVSGRSRAQFPVESAEVQIKTMLHDGWGAKTHDLTYKPQGEIDRNLHRHMEILGDVLQHLDDQSELIKDAIRQRWNTDVKQREIARDRLFLSLINRTDVAHASELEALAKEIHDNKSLLATMDFSNPTMTTLVDKIDGLKALSGPGRDICRLYTLFASIRATTDMLGTALNAIDEWQAAVAGEPRQQVIATNFRALTYYAVGSLESAVLAAREALNAAIDAGMDTGVALAKSNLAYFLSELVFSLPVRDEALAKEALALSKEAFAAANPAVSMSAHDTRGAVLIALGTTEGQIRAGMELCQAARDEINRSEKERHGGIFSPP